MLSFLPKVIFCKLTDIPPAYLHARGICLLMLDFDNTMLPYTTDVPDAQLLAWLRQMKEAGIQICIVSNSKRQRVPQFGQKYGVDVVTHAKKPFQRGIRQCLARYDVKPEHAALCGDQIYTDVLGANCGGVYAILVKSIHNHNFWLKLRHVAEMPFIILAKGRKYHYEKS